MSTVAVIAIIAAMVLFFILYITARLCKQLQAENFQLKEKAEAQQKTIADLLRHAEEVSRISQDKGTVQEKIENAKTDEELVNIANAIIDANNASMHQQAKKRK